MSEYNGRYLEIITLALAGVSLLVVLIRGVTRYRTSRVVESPDVLLPVALVSGRCLSSIGERDL